MFVYVYIRSNYFKEYLLKCEHRTGEIVIIKEYAVIYVFVCSSYLMSWTHFLLVNLSVGEGVGRIINRIMPISRKTSTFITFYFFVSISSAIPKSPTSIQLNTIKVALPFHRTATIAASF